MAPSGRIFLFILLTLVIQLTQPSTEDQHSGAARRSAARSRRSSTRRTYRTRTYTTGTGYGTGTYGSGLTWWQICLIIGGILFVFLVLYCCIRACRQPREPTSDTPGIQTTRDQIQLRDHHTIHDSPAPNYQQLPCSEGREIPPPPLIMHHQPSPVPYGKPTPHAQMMPGPMATAPPPPYDDAMEITKEPIGESAVDEWEDEPEISRKDFGVV